MHQLAAGPRAVYNIAAKPLPTRHDREVIVQAATAPDEFKNRTPAETVQAINLALKLEAAVAWRRLPSGDVAVTFRDKAKPFLEDTAWVQQAFGTEASLRRRIYSVIAKGIRRSSLHDYEALKTEMSKTNQVEILHAKAMRTNREDARRLNLVIGLPSPQEANKLCSHGLIVDAEVFEVEPYDGNVQPRQCFKCFRFGHIAKFCTAAARCGHCGATAHADGEEACPARQGQIPPKCLLCSQQHPAWSRDCPEAKKHWDKAREAYQWRPRRFEAGTERASG